MIMYIREEEHNQTYARTHFTFDTNINNINKKSYIYTTRKI